MGKSEKQVTHSQLIHKSVYGEEPLIEFLLHIHTIIPLLLLDKKPQVKDSTKQMQEQNHILTEK